MRATRTARRRLSSTSLSRCCSPLLMSLAIQDSVHSAGRTSFCVGHSTLHSLSDIVNGRVMQYLPGQPQASFSGVATNGEEGLLPAADSLLAVMRIVAERPVDTA